MTSYCDLQYQDEERHLPNTVQKSIICGAKQFSGWNLGRFLFCSVEVLIVAEKPQHLPFFTTASEARHFSF